MRRFAPALIFLLVFSGCASLPLVGQFVTVSVPSELPLPDTLTLELGAAAGKSMGLGNQILGALGGESIEQKLGRTLKDSALPLRKAGADAFKRQLEEAKLFGAIVHSGGNLGISLGVSRWGLAYNAVSRKLEPVLDLEAKLSAPGLGVVWAASRSAKDLGSQVLDKMSGLGVSALLTKPQGFNDAMAVAATELSRQLVEDLRKNPPQR